MTVTAALSQPVHARASGSAVEHRVTTPSLVIQLQDDTCAVSKTTTVFSETLLEPDTTTRWVYTKDATPEGGTTHHVMWAKTPGPVVDRIVDWFGSI